MDQFIDIHGIIQVGEHPHYMFGVVMAIEGKRVTLKVFDVLKKMFGQDVNVDLDPNDKTRSKWRYLAQDSKPYNIIKAAFITSFPKVVAPPANHKENEKEEDIIDTDETMDFDDDEYVPRVPLNLSLLAKLETTTTSVEDCDLFKDTKCSGNDKDDGFKKHGKVEKENGEIETMKEMIAKEVGRLVKTNGVGAIEHDPYVCGQLSREQQMEFEQHIDSRYKNKHVGGGFTGIVSKEQAKPGQKKPKSTKVMCSFYKGVSHKCFGKRLNKTNDVFKSPPAEYVHVSLLSDMRYRTSTSVDAISKLKHHAFCSPCKTQGAIQGGHKSKDYINVVQHTYVCALCKKDSQCVKSAMGVIMCSECEKASNEQKIKRVLKVLRRVFPCFKLSKYKNATTNVFNTPGEHLKKKQKSFKIPDYVMHGEVDSVKVLIVVECDEKKHADYDKQDEREKMIKQTASWAFKIKNPADVNIDKLKMVMIRFNPDTECNMGTREVPNIHRSELPYRLIVMRQWVTWFLLNAVDVRNVMIWYMFYDNDDETRSKLLLSKDPGFSMIYAAPKPPVPSQEWIYCVDPREGTLSTRTKSGEDAWKDKAGLIASRVNVDHQLTPKWRIDGSVVPATFMREYLLVAQGGQ